MIAIAIIATASAWIFHQESRAPTMADNTQGSADEVTTEPPSTTSSPARANRATATIAPPVVDETHEDIDTIEDFGAAIDRLCTIAERMRRHITNGKTDSIKPLDREAEAVLIGIGNRFPNAGERALEQLAQLPPSEADLRIIDRRNVLVRVLRDDLLRRWHSFERGGPSSGLDALVQAVLELLPSNPVLARALGTELLVGAPFLGSAHEASVLNLIDVARSESWLAPTASSLLRTLWQNLLTRNERSRGAIESLALAFLEQTDGIARSAAIDVLVTDPTLRGMLIERARRRADVGLAESLAQSAATNLDPKTALSVVRDLHSLGSFELLGACMQLGLRDQASVRLAYEEALGDLRDPAFRANLISGMFMTPHAEGLELLEIALREDPAVEVRERALLQLTALDDSSIGERAIDAVLGDPRFESHTDVVGLCVSAFSNLARRADRATIERVAARLLAHPKIRAADRDRVKELAKMG